MVDISYSYYKDEFKGNSVGETEFPKLSEQAKIYVSNRTFGNADYIEADHPLAERVKFTVCTVVDLIKANTGEDGTEHGAITSESVGGSWSRTYKVSEKDSSRSLDDIVYDKIYTLLSSTGLLYGGVCL